jgi:hypothetical protein
MTICTSRVGVCLLVPLTAPVPLARAQTAPVPAASGLDFERYRKEIEPIFLKHRQGLGRLSDREIG